MRDNKIVLQNITNRFYDYKMGMKLDILNFIDEAKNLGDKMINQSLSLTNRKMRQMLSRDGVPNMTDYG